MPPCGKSMRNSGKYLNTAEGIRPKGYMTSEYGPRQYEVAKICNKLGHDQGYGEAVGRQEDTGEPMKILIVDDHPLIREALRHVLAVLDAKFQLIEAQNFAEALAAAAAHPDLDLILLDLGLPDIDGIAALTELRNQHPHAPVVVLSASEQPATVMRALDAGAMGFVPKTTSSHLLVNALRLVLSGGVYLPAEILRQHQGAPESALQLAAAASRGGKMLTPQEIGLTARQSEVLGLLVQGKPNKLICRDLGLAEGTVKIHVTAILKALNVVNRTQAVIAVGKLGLQLPQK